MKKVFGILAIAGLFVATSCNKTYTCEVAGVEGVEISSKDYTDTQIDALKAACEAGGGTWKTK
ncbi:MAG: hypothetical protein R2799_13835 [Crocinitomicaceae bacterium]